MSRETGIGRPESPEEIEEQMMADAKRQEDLDEKNDDRSMESKQAGRKKKSQ